MSATAPIAARVMACYFHDSVAQASSLCSSKDPQAGMLALLSLNAPSHPIRNRLLRLTSDSPDLLAIIKQEGKV